MEHHTNKIAKSNSIINLVHKKKHKRPKPKLALNTSQQNLNSFTTFYLKQSQDTQAAKQALKLQSRDQISYENWYHELRNSFISDDNNQNHIQNTNQSNFISTATYRQPSYHHHHHQRNLTIISNSPSNRSSNFLRKSNHSLTTYKTIMDSSRISDEVVKNNENEKYELAKNKSKSISNKKTTKFDKYIIRKCKIPKIDQIMQINQNQQHVTFSKIIFPPPQTLFKTTLKINGKSLVDDFKNKLSQKISSTNASHNKKRQSKSQWKLSQFRDENQLKKLLHLASSKIFKQNQFLQNINSKQINFLRGIPYKKSNQPLKKNSTKQQIDTNQMVQKQKDKKNITQQFLQKKQQLQLQNKSHIKKFLAKMRNKNFNRIKQKIQGVQETPSQLVTNSKIGKIWNKIFQYNHTNNLLRHLTSINKKFQ